MSFHHDPGSVEVLIEDGTNAGPAVEGLVAESCNGIFHAFPGGGVEGFVVDAANVGYLASQEISSGSSTTTSDVSSVLKGQNNHVL